MSTEVGYQPVGFGLEGTGVAWDYEAPAYEWIKDVLACTFSTCFRKCFKDVKV